MRNNKMKGFTLVELLVVIAILAILATVSVVGYTSFIERANVSNDENIAAQLNNFLVAVKADSNGPFYGEDITEDNIWEVTQYILHDSGLEGKLVPNSAKHGYHFYFDLTDGKYMVLKDNKALAENSGIDKIINLAMKAYAAGEDLHAPGNCFTVDNRYFLVDTEGSNLANVIRQFYTFDEENVEDKFNFTEFYALSQGSDIPTALKALASQSVFVTKEGMFKGEGALTNIFFHDDEGLQLMETPNITLTAVDGKVAPIVIPANVKYFGIGAINVTVNGTASNAPVIIERYAEELSTCLSEDFTNVNFVLADGKEWQMTIGATGGEYAGTPVITTVEASNVEYPIGGTNTMSDFDIFVNASNKSYTSEMENTNGVNVLNIPTIVWHTGSITLGLYEKDIKAEDTTKPVSSKRVTWTLTNADGTSATYTGVNLTEEGVLSFERVNGMYPTHSVIYVTATAVRGETAKTFAINLSRGSDASITVDDEVAVNNAITVLWGENANEVDGYKNSYTIGATLNNWENKVSDSFTYDNDIVLVVDNTNKTDGEKLTADNTKKTISTTTYILGDSTTTKDITFKVIVGGYYEETVTVTLSYAKVLFNIKNVGITHIGTDGVNVTVEELFTGSAPADSEVLVNAYAIPAVGAGNTMQELKEYAVPAKAEDAEDGVYGTGSAGLDGSFDFNLTGLADGHIILVVTVDGVRASANYELTVVPGTNVNTYAGITGTIPSGNTENAIGSNIVLLGDVTMTSDKNYLKIPANTTFYGNCYKFDITAGRIKEEGIINLYGKIQDTKVVGQVYTEFGMRAGSDYGSSAICAKGGKSVIENCYVANCRSPLRLSQDCTVINSVFFGGRYSNIDITGGILTIQGEVVTVNQRFNYNGTEVLGTGITFWWSANSATSKVVVDTANKGHLTQYNFVSIEDAESGAMPSLGLVEFAAEAGIDIGFLSSTINALKKMGIFIGIDFGDIFKSILQTSKFSSAIFDGDTMNTGLFYLNKTISDTNITNLDAKRMGVYDYVFDPDDHQGSLLAYVTKQICKKVVNGENFPVMTNLYLNHTAESAVNNNPENKKMYEDSANAVTKYWFDTYNFVNGNIVH